jgi:hypothetical protein
MTGWIHISAPIKTSEKGTYWVRDIMNMTYLELIVLACVRISSLTRDTGLAVQLLTVHLLPPGTTEIDVIINISLLSLF